MPAHWLSFATQMRHSIYCYPTARLKEKFWTNSIKQTLGTRTEVQIALDSFNQTFEFQVMMLSCDHNNYNSLLL